MNTFCAPDGAVMRVLGNRLLVRIDAPPQETKGGILFSNAAAQNPHATGTIVAVGFLTGERAPRHTEIPGLRVGDRILFLRLLSISDSNPTLQRILDDSVVAIRPADVLLLFAEEDLSRIR